MDDTSENTCDMGNKVSGSSRQEDTGNQSTGTKDGDEADHAASTYPPPSDNTTPPIADPDSAKEIAHLEECATKTSAVDLDLDEDFSNRSANDGNGSAELHLMLDSDTESRSGSSKKSSQSIKQRDSNMEDVSSEDEFESMKRSARCMSTESIVSNEERQRPETPCLDERESAPSPIIPTGCEPLSESDRESEAEKEPELLTLSDAKGMKIVIRSIEEELDDIESEEGSFSEQEVAAKKEKKKNILQGASEEMAVQIKEVESVVGECDILSYFCHYLIATHCASSSSTFPKKYYGDA